MTHQPDPDTSLVLSYLGLRKAVGIIGTALPFVLAIGKVLLESPGLEDSISAYYYTVMQGVFVGSLCAIAVFLMSYRGYERKDHVAGVLACIFGVGIALFPTTPAVADPSRSEKIIGGVHYFCAASFFLTLAYFSLVLFTKTDSPGHETARKLQRNRIYTACGYTILACLALIVVVALLHLPAPTKFWPESVAVFVFGFSWLTKGEALLKDIP